MGVMLAWGVFILSTNPIVGSVRSHGHGNSFGDGIGGMVIRGNFTLDARSVALLVMVVLVFGADDC